MEKFFSVSASMKLTSMQLVEDFGIYKTLFSTEQASALGGFSALMRGLRQKFESADPLQFTAFLVKETGIENEIRKSSENEDVARIKLDNISAFFDAVSTDPSLPEHKTARSFFARFVNNVSLLGSGEEESRDGKVTIITAHSAKGLEFDRVFIPGFYQGGFPNHLAIEEFNVDEERRLAYVAFTRAKKRLVITIPETVSFRGNTRKTEPSVFIRESELNGEKYGGPPLDQNKMIEAMLAKLRKG